MRIFTRRIDPERLLWSRDIRFINRIAMMIEGVRLLELDSGTVVIGPAHILTPLAVADVAEGARNPEYGLVMVDPSRSESERYLLAMSAAVQVSGLADRIGMSQSSQVVQTKMLDYFFSLRALHGIAFQPIVDLATGELHEYECMFRPQMPQLPQSITSIVAAAIDTERSVELDMFIVHTILDHAGRLEAVAREAGKEPRRYAVNMTPASLLDPGFRAPLIAEMVRSVGLSPSRITIECTEQQSVPDLEALQRQVKALRKLGFGFAVDDAGAGYASFALVAALRPSIIKIDREITHGISRDDARHALVEAFFLFSRRIGAKLVAEGIETRADLAKLREIGVDYGQGYLLGKPKPEPMKPRNLGPVKPRAKDEFNEAPRSRTIEGMTEALRTLKPRVRDFLSTGRHFATIATIDADGASRQAVIWYRMEGDDLIINSLVGRRWPTNLLRDSRISVAVAHSEDGYRWVGIVGNAAPITDQPTAQADIAAMARHYHADEPAKAERMITDRFGRQERISFRVRAGNVHDHLDE